MDFTGAYVMAGLGTLLSLFWLIMFIAYEHKFDEVIGAIDKKKYMLGELYFIGFGFIQMLNINLKSKKGRKKIISRIH